MICERSVVIFTCAVLSNLTNYSGSLATEPKILKSTSLDAPIILQTSSKKSINDKQHQVTFISSNSQAQQKKSLPKPEKLNNQSQQEPTKVINDNWSIVGLSLTSLLFLIVNWLLFQPNSRNQEQATDTNLNEVDDLNSIIEDDAQIEVLEEEKTVIPEPLPMVLEEEETIIPEPLPMVLEEEETIIPEPLPMVLEEEETIIPEPLPIVLEEEETIIPEPLPIVLEEEETIIPEPLPIVLEEEETIIPQPLPMIGMEYTEEVLPSFKPTETSIETSVFGIEQNTNDEHLINEETSKPLDRQIVPLANQEGLTSQQEQLNTQLQKRSLNQNEVLNKVTIVTAKTTEIDVVFELLQDLQQSDRFLRRKAIWKLAHTGDFRAIEPLVAIIPKVDSVDKTLILDAITKIAQRSWQPINKALYISLKDQNAEVKKNAIRDATVLYKSILPLTQCLSQMLGDSDREVQQTARWALQQFQQQLSLAPSSIRSQESEIENRK
jgi:hypothetical protein